jgi:thiol-disulfide isomerase/thioredoxin
MKISKSWLWILTGLAVGLLAGLAFIFFFAPGMKLLNQSNVSISPAVPQVNSPAPDFELQSLDGTPVSLSSLRGRVVLVNFWATWCGPCRLEMPLLQDAQNRYQDKLEVLAVNNNESSQTIKSFVNDLGLRLQVLLDPGAKIAQQYRVRGFPTTIFIDPEGTTRYEHIGVLNQDTLNGYLADLGVTP